MYCRSIGVKQILRPKKNKGWSCQVAETTTAVVNAFIKNKNWQTQANLNHCINCKIQEHAKGSGHVQTGYHRTRLKSDSKKANEGQKQDSQT